MADVLLIFKIGVGNMPIAKGRECLEGVMRTLDPIFGHDERVKAIYFPIRESTGVDVQAIPLKAMLEGRCPPDINGEDLRQVIDLVESLGPPLAPAIPAPAAIPVVEPASGPIHWAPRAEPLHWEARSDPL